MPCCLSEAPSHAWVKFRIELLVFNGPDRERESENTEDKTKYNEQIQIWRRRAEFKQASFVLWWLFLSHCRVTLTTTTQVENSSGCSQMSRTGEWNVLCWGGGGSRWEREKKKGGNRAIDSSPSYPYCLWAHVGWTCWTPTERPAVREKERQQWGDILATGSTDDKRERRADKDRADSLPVCLCLFVSDVSMYTGISETGRYSLSTHTFLTHSRK